MHRTTQTACKSNKIYREAVNELTLFNTRQKFSYNIIYNHFVTGLSTVLMTYNAPRLIVLISDDEHSLLSFPGVFVSFYFQTTVQYVYSHLVLRDLSPRDAKTSSYINKLHSQQTHSTQYNSQLMVGYDLSE